MTHYFYLSFKVELYLICILGARYSNILSVYKAFNEWKWKEDIGEKEGKGLGEEGDERERKGWKEIGRQGIQGNGRKGKRREDE